MVRFWLVAAMVVSVSNADACVSKKPVDVLQCMANAITMQDIDAYEALLHPDYVFVGRDGEPGMTRAADLELTVAFFADMSDITMNLTPSKRVTRDRSGSWTLYDVEQIVHLVTTDGATYDVHNVVPRIVVAPGANGQFQVLAWTEPVSE